jgi:hypothetical protein
MEIETERKIEMGREIMEIETGRKREMRRQDDGDRDR